MFLFPKNLEIADSELSSIIQVVYSRVENFLKYPLHIHYTDHSIEHSIRVLEVISNILDETNICLSDVEKYIIICAALLHDVGMQTPHFLNKSPLSTDDLEEIRKNHHLYSEKMIIESVTKPVDNRYYFGLEPRLEYVELIATIAKAHRKVNLIELDNEFIGNEEIRVRFLSALLRLSDCLDMDYRRVDVERLSSLNIPVSSKMFWFRHQYVQGVKIYHQKIEIFFSFPKAYENEDECINTLTNDTFREVSDQVDEVYDFLDDYGLRLHKKISYKVSYSLVQRCMPDELIAYIKTLCETNVIKSDKVFDVYPTRELCIDDILKKIKDTGAEKVVFFGGISSRLCHKSTVEIFSEWLCRNENSMLFFCYEDDEAALSRATSLDEAAMPQDSLPSDPHMRYIYKLGNIEKCREMYSEEIRERVYLIPITKALNTYSIVMDNDFYCNILTAIRSSESTTAKMRDNSVGKKTKIELLSYMLFILENSPPCEGNSILSGFFQIQKNMIK